MASLWDGDFEISPTEFLRPEFQIEKKWDAHSKKEIEEKLWAAFDQVATNLKKERLQEGMRLKEVLQTHLRIVSQEVKKIESLTETYQKRVESRLMKRLDEFKGNLDSDDNRFYQEVVYYLEKLDIHEEIHRIDSHLEELELLLRRGGEVGRKMEFLLQELNRETNTIGSKSGMKEISQSVVQIKVHLEKMREQALNLE